MAKQNKRGTPTNVALDATKQKEFNQKIHKIKGKKTASPAVTASPAATASPAESIPGVVYMSRLPWGFEEEPMREYFKQFGTIKRMRVARSKKTGNSKGYAYIQFTHDDVAKIVAETMNNYLMFGKLIKCKHLQRPHPATFKHARRQFLAPVAQKHAISERNKPKTEETLEKNKSKLLTKFRKKMAQLSEQGIEYSLEGMDVPKKTETEKKENAGSPKQPRKRKPSDEWKTMGTPEPKKQLKTPKSGSRKENDNEQEKSEIKPPKKTPKKTPKTPKNLSLLPKTVNTPQGKMNVVIEDSSEDEIMFKTPPQSIKSSKLELVTDSDSTPATPAGRKAKGLNKSKGGKSGERTGKMQLRSAGRKSFGGKGTLKGTPSQGKKRRSQ